MYMPEAESEQRRYDRRGAAQAINVRFNPLLTANNYRQQGFVHDFQGAKTAAIPRYFL